MLVVGFSSGHSLTDRAIQVVEVGLWHHLGAPRPLANHCWIERRVGAEAAEGVEAVWDGARRFFAAGKDATPETVRCYAVPCMPEQERRAWDAAAFAARRRTPYNRWGLLKALWYVATGRRTDAFSRDPAATVFCSELVVNCLRSAGIAVEMEHPTGGALIGVPSDDITPARLEVYAVTHGYTRIA